MFDNFKKEVLSKPEQRIDEQNKKCGKTLWTNLQSNVTTISNCLRVNGIEIDAKEDNKKSKAVFRGSRCKI